MEHVWNYEFIGDLRIKLKLGLRTHDNNQGCLDSRRPLELLNETLCGKLKPFDNTLRIGTSQHFTK